MAYLTITLQEVVNIMRKVIGERDASSPDATDEILLQYINEFIQLQFPYNAQLFEEWSWYEFDTVANQFVYPFGADKNGVEFSVLRPPAYSVDPDDPNDFAYNMRWYQDPQEFYGVWGYITDLSALSVGQPQDILFWNQEFTLRLVPDKVYNITIKGYRKKMTLELSDNVEYPYLYRYLAYGAARDYLSDYLDIATLSQITPLFEEYRSKVLHRTAQQQIPQKSVPRF